MRYLSVCSGIEAVSVAWGPLGWQPAMFAEINPFCCWLLRSRYRERKADPTREMAGIKEQVAKQFDLPFVDGGIQIPDARIEYDLPREAGQDPSLDQDQGSRTGHEDIEVLTAAYHAGHLRSKAQAGFRNYASAADRSSITAKIEDDSHLMENILEL